MVDDLNDKEVAHDLVPTTDLKKRASVDVNFLVDADPSANLKRRPSFWPADEQRRPSFWPVEDDEDGTYDDGKTTKPASRTSTRTTMTTRAETTTTAAAR